MLYQELAPIPSLEPFIRCVWRRQFDIKDNIDRLRLFPDGCVELVFSCREPVTYQLSNGAKSDLPDASVIGTFTQPVEMHFHGQTELIGVRFLPTRASRFVLAGMTTMTDQIVCCAEVLETGIQRRLRESAATLNSLPAIQNVLSDCLRMTVKTELATVADEIVDSHGYMPALSVAENSGVHERRLRRWFNNHVGVTPQTLSRILRFRRAYELLKVAEHLDLANVAIKCGYFDQSHMVRDFKKFSGQSPASLVKRTRPILARLASHKQ